MPEIIIVEELELPKAEFFYVEDAIDVPNEIYEKLKEEIPWQQEDSFVYGKFHKQPRLTCLISEDDKPYTYSGLKRKVFPMSETILKLMKEVQEIVELVKPGHPKYTSVLCNYYEDGTKNISRHSDDENDIIKNTIISSLSFGAERNFDLFSKKKSKDDKEIRVKRLKLKNGSWLGMGENSQKLYKHEVPIQNKIKEGRINLTFRVLKSEII